MEHNPNCESGPGYVIDVHDGPIPDRTSSKSALPFAHCEPIKLRGSYGIAGKLGNGGQAIVSTTFSEHTHMGH